MGHVVNGELSYGGRPQLRALAKQIEGLGGDEWFFAQVVNGSNISKLAAELGTSRAQIYNWLNKDKSGGRSRRLAEAKKLRAHTLVEDAQAQLEGDNLTHPSRLSAIANHKRWMAQHDNREEYGDPVPGSTVVNIGELHLQALVASGQSRVRGSAPDLPTTKKGYLRPQGEALALPPFLGGDGKVEAASVEER